MSQDRLTKLSLVLMFGLTCCNNHKSSDVADSCVMDETRCDGETLQKCSEGAWEDWHDCEIDGQRCLTDHGEAVCLDISGSDADGDTDTDTDTDMDVYSDTDTDVNFDIETDTDTNADENDDTTSDTDNVIDIGSDSDTEGDTDAATDRDVDTDVDGDTNSGADTSVDSDEDSFGDTESRSDDDPSSDTDTNEGTEPLRDPTLCGNGEIDDGELCDDGDANTYDYTDTPVCNKACTGYSAYCGDGILQGEEICDSGASNSDDYSLERHCDADCGIWKAFCGDDILNGDENCDDGSENGLWGNCSLDCTHDCIGDDPACFAAVESVLACEGGLEVWSADRKYYAVDGEVQVPEGCVLSIEPGVRIQMFNGGFIRVLGSIKSLGTEKAHIEFTANEAVLYMVMVNEKASNLEFAFTDFHSLRYQNDASAIRSPRGIDVDNCTFSNFGTGISIFDVSSESIFIKNSIFTNHFSGIKLDRFNGLAEISRNTFWNSTFSIGLQHTEHSVRIGDNVFRGDSSEHIRIEFSSDIQIYHNDFGKTSASAVYLFHANDIITLTYNNIGNIYAGGYENVQIHRNNFLGVSEQFVKLGSNGGLDASENYWGEAVTAEMTTSDGNPDANISVFIDYYDDVRLGKVLYDNWLTQQEPTAGPR